MPVIPNPDPQVWRMILESPGLEPGETQRSQKRGSGRVTPVSEGPHGAGRAQENQSDAPGIESPGRAGGQGSPKRRER
jgi:hypothetical protein